MAILNMYRRVSLPSVVAESQSSCIFLAMDLVDGPDLDLLPSHYLSKAKSLGSDNLSTSSS